MKIPNVILFPDTEHSVCSYWRANGVYQQLEKDGLIKLAISNYDATWTKLMRYDVAIFQRPMTRFAAKQVFYAKDMMTKAILDFDDLNYIPPTHPVYKPYTEMYSESDFFKMMLSADVVQVSTPYLKNHYLQYNQNIHVVPNSLNDYNLKIRKFKNSKQAILRLGAHHEEDVYYFKDEIIEVFNAHPDWKLHVMGSNPIYLRNEIPNYVFVADFDIHDYLAYNLNSATSAVVVPLIDSEFNRAKSNISWIEATMFGGCALTPSFLPDTKSFQYTDKESFKEQLILMLENEEARQEKYSESVALIESKYLLSQTNKQRMEIINNLMK